MDGLYHKIASGDYSSVAIDSREVGEGALFFALKGERVHGCQFLSEVASSGAKAAVVPEEYEGKSYGLELFRTEDVLGSLHSLARRHYSDFPVRSVGVTGSVGKTTMKEFLATLLSARFCVAKTLRSANAQASFPLAVLNRNKSEEILVMEMGMSQAGELAKLAAIAPPDLALVGRVAYAHAEFFEDGIEGIARAKAEILSQPRTKAAILHSSTAGFSPFKENFSGEKILYGEGDYLLEEVGDQLCILEGAVPSPLFQLPFQGSHLRENFLAAAAAARWFGLEWEEILGQIGQLHILPMRFELLEKEGVRYINDAYNSNPASLAAALENLSRFALGKRIAVIGEMRELGKFSASLHRELGKKALDCVDLLIAYGKETLPLVEVFTEAGRPACHFLCLQEIKRELQSVVEPGDLVLLKASNSNALWKILE